MKNQAFTDSTESLVLYKQVKLINFKSVLYENKSAHINYLDRCLHIIVEQYAKHSSPECIYVR